MLLAADENQIQVFLNESHRYGRRFDISRITSLDTLPADQLEAIATRLR